MNNVEKKVLATKFNFIEKQKVKEETILSIQKNIICLDTLENIKNNYTDIFKYTQSRDDEIKIEEIEWVIFQIEWNNDLFFKSLKKLGGKVSDVKPFVWK